MPVRKTRKKTKCLFWCSDRENKKEHPDLEKTFPDRHDRHAGLETEKLFLWCDDRKNKKEHSGL